MSGSIFETLEKLKLTSKESRTLFSDGTRDVEGLQVWRDRVSEVIYIDEFYTGDSAYIDGNYRDEKSRTLGAGKPDLERVVDAERRFASNLKFVAGKDLADFGCGSGDFLKLAQPYCKNITGIELQRDYVDQLVD